MYTMNILVIDDDPVARMLITRFLSIKGFEGAIYTAENGQEGFDLMTSTSDKFVIVLDYHMPVLDGSGLLKKMAENNISHPVLLLSSSSVEELEAEFQAYDFVKGYFDKPIDLNKTKIILDYAEEFSLQY